MAPVGAGSNNFAALDDSWEPANKNKKNNKNDSNSDNGAATRADRSSTNGNGSARHETKQGGHGHSAKASNNSHARGRANVNANGIDDAVAVAEELARSTTDESGRVRLWRDWARQVRVQCVKKRTALCCFTLTAHRAS